MLAKTSKILLAGVVLALLTGNQPMALAGWSLPNPLSSENKTETKSKKSTARTTKKEPSTLDKIGSDTKRFFDQTGESLGLKKPEAKNTSPSFATPKMPTLQPRKKKAKPSWFDSMWKSPEPEEPRTVKEWMGNKRLDP